jgi:phospholipid/cholesterol/gamma-HCH transport system substrate-binding protein
MSRSVVIRIAAAVVGVLVLVAAGVGTNNGLKTGGNNTTLVGMFADASPLDNGSDIRMSGVKVGSVTDIQLDNGVAKVTFKVDPSALPVHQDAKLTMRTVNVLGEHYVELDPGSDSKPFLEPQVIPKSQTTTAPGLPEVLNTFDDPTSTALAALVTTLGEGMDSSGGNTAAAIAALAPAMNNTKALGDLLNGQNDVLKQVLDRAQPVASALDAQDGQVLDRLVGNAKTTLSTLSADQQAMGETLDELPATLTDARTTLNHLSAVSDAATPTLQGIRPVTDNLQQITGELHNFSDAADPALQALQPVLQRANSLLDQAAPVVAQIRQAGPNLRSVSKGVRPLSDQLLDQHLGDLMDFVKKWSLSTNGRDGLGHYFRGVIHVTPEVLKNLAASLTPGPGASAAQSPAPPGQEPAAPPSAALPLPNLGGFLPGAAPGAAQSDPNNATGLTSTQEQSLLGQLLGGL